MVFNRTGNTPPVTSALSGTWHSLIKCGGSEKENRFMASCAGVAPRVGGMRCGSEEVVQDLQLQLLD